MSKIGIILLLLIILGGGYYFFQTEESSLISFNVNLESLDQGHYEGWAIFGDEKVSTGKFDAGENLMFTLDRDLSDADSIAITIEPEGDTDSEPSSSVVLIGNLDKDVDEGQTVALSFPINFSNAAGNYILATPTNGGDSNETSGIWFLSLPAPPKASLTLPELPVGWIYEGWVVYEGKPLTSGRFSLAEGEDDFNGFSGPVAGPPFPGEDYLINSPNGVVFPINLANGSSKVVVSVEPDNNGEDPTGPSPFQAKPLVADISSLASDHENYAMSLNLESLPTGTAVIE